MDILKFKPVTIKDGAKLRRYYKNCNYGLCEYSVGIKLMLSRTLDIVWAETHGCLIVRNNFNGELAFDYPIPGPDGDVDAALTAVEQWCIHEGLAPVLAVIPEAQVPYLLSRYPHAQVSNVRTWQDYVYAAEDLRSFPGRRYSGQRNHINKFRAVCPGAEFKVLTKEDRPLIDAFWRDYDAVFTKTSQVAVGELRSSKRMLRQAGSPWFCCGGMLWQGKLLSLCLAETCGETLIVHIEKALYGYEGIYPATVQAAAQAFGGDVKWINREDDAADAGLRTSKLQYRPAQLLPKYRLRAQNELETKIHEIPTLKTERLTLTPLTKADAELYYALCTNVARNAMWGYDDIAGVGDQLSDREIFLKVAERDFENHLALNFAIRQDGNFIGEVVLFSFDYRGGAEIGCRIAPEYTGNRYSYEAQTAVVLWALYEVHMTRVVSKCFKANPAPMAITPTFMRAIGEDETYCYFERTV